MMGQEECHSCHLARQFLSPVIVIQLNLPALQGTLRPCRQFRMLNWFFIPQNSYKMTLLQLDSAFRFKILSNFGRRHLIILAGDNPKESDLVDMNAI